jgi:CheY-like chemotaxis protein
MDTQYKNRKMLVADDSADDRYLLKLALANCGLDVKIDFVEDGPEALDYLAGRGNFRNLLGQPLPDLFLLDINMPRMDGFEVLQALRQELHLFWLPVIMHSTSNRREDIGLALALGANSYLCKPALPAELARLLGCLCRYWLELHCRYDCRTGEDPFEIMHLRLKPPFIPE